MIFFCRKTSCRVAEGSNQYEHVVSEVLGLRRSLCLVREALMMLDATSRAAAGMSSESLFFFLAPPIPLGSSCRLRRHEELDESLGTYLLPQPGCPEQLKKGAKTRRVATSLFSSRHR